MATVGFAVKAQWKVPKGDPERGLMETRTRRVSQVYTSRAAAENFLALYSREYPDHEAWVANIRHSPTDL